MNIALPLSDNRIIHIHQSYHLETIYQKYIGVLFGSSIVSDWLLSRTTDITEDVTGEFSCIYDAFSDAMFIAQIKEEIEKVKSYRFELY